MDNLELINELNNNSPSEGALKDFAYELRRLYEQYDNQSNELDEQKNE